MKTTKPLAAFAVAALLATVPLVPANAQQAGHHPGAAGKAMPGGMAGMKGGAGMMMGKMGMMGKGGMMGKMGMMGKGGMMGMMHKKMMGHHMGITRTKPLSAEGIGRVVNGRLSMLGLTRLKAANVKIKDDKTATADLVTAKGEMIARLSVDRQSGMSKIIE